MAPSPLPRAALLVAVLCVLSSPARAQSDSARAESLIRQANALRQKGQDPAALPLFREAYDVARSPRTAAQLGLVELALGYWVPADDHLSEALAPTGHPWINQNRAVLDKARKDARDHIGTLVIEGHPPGAEVQVNASPVGNLPLPGPIRVGEGTVTVEVKAPGHNEARRTLAVRGNATERVRLDLQAVAVRLPPAQPPSVHVVPASMPPPPPPPVLPAWRTTLPWILGAGAVTAAGVGVWQHVGWRKAQSDFEQIDLCGKDSEGRGSDPRCQGLYDTLSSRRTGTYVGYGVAGALGAGAAVMILLNARAEQQLEILAGSRALNVSVRGRF